MFLLGILLLSKEYGIRFEKKLNLNIFIYVVNIKFFYSSFGKIF